MKNLRNRFERFCFQHRNWGIPNLMLFITIGQALVYLFTRFSGDYALYNILCFNRDAVLQGQIWRLISYPLTTNTDNYLILVVVSLICYYSLGRAMENIWGTLRFNLFYLGGIVLMDIFAMACGGMTFRYGDVTDTMSASYYAAMGTYLNLSLFLGYATLYPNTHFLLFFIIPVKAWIFALFYLGVTVYEVIAYSVPVFCFPHNLFPLVALGNYFLFFGKDVCNVIPLSWRMWLSRRFRRKGSKTKTVPKTEPIPFTRAQKNTPPREAYNHRCTVCGRTDVSNPELEFRYCSRCNGYHCYCEDHISDHTHIE